MDEVIRDALRALREARRLANPLPLTGWDRVVNSPEQQAVRAQRAQRRQRYFKPYSDDDLFRWYERVDDDEDIFQHLADEIKERAKTSPRAAEYWNNATGG